MKTIDWQLNNFQPSYNDKQHNTFLNTYTICNTPIVDIADFTVDSPPLFNELSYHHHRHLLLLLPLLLLEGIIINVFPLILDEPIQWLQPLR